MRLLHEIAIFQTVKSKVKISLFKTVRLSVSISQRNLYNSLNSVKEKSIFTDLLIIMKLMVQEFKESLRNFFSEQLEIPYNNEIQSMQK